MIWSTGSFILDRTPIPSSDYLVITVVNGFRLIRDTGRLIVSNNTDREASPGLVINNVELLSGLDGPGYSVIDGSNTIPLSARDCLVATHTNNSSSTILVEITNGIKQDHTVKLYINSVLQDSLLVQGDSTNTYYFTHDSFVVEDTIEIVVVPNV